MLLANLGFKTVSTEDKLLLMQETEKARAAAVAVGVENVGEPNDGNPLINFWVLVQLLRVLYARDDKRILDREARAVELTRFSATEVEEFRDVFMSWFSKDRAFEEDTWCPR